MGRPRIHHTPDERRAANRAKSKRHYDKCRASIAMKRGLKNRDGYRRSLVTYATLEVQNKNMPSSTQTHGEDPPLEENPAKFWSNRVNQVERKFRALVGDSAFQYIDGLCTAFYTTNYDKNTLRDPLSAIMRLRTRIRQYQDHILQQSGVGSEWTRSEGVAKCIGQVVTSLEEALCLAEAGRDEMATCHAEGSMWFQVNRI